MEKVIRYRPPMHAQKPDTFIRFNIAMTGMSMEEVSIALGVRRSAVEQAAKDRVARADFIAKALAVFTNMTFADLFMVCVETDGVFYMHRAMPLPISYEQALDIGLREEEDPTEASQEPRINIYDDDVPVLGFTVDGALHRYGDRTRKSGIAKWIIKERERLGLHV